MPKLSSSLFVFVLCLGSLLAQGVLSKLPPTPVLEMTDEMSGRFLDAAYVIIPHPEKALKGGEDACFLSDRVLAVADGVGGWADQGVDPSLYSRLLMEGTRNAAVAAGDAPVNPVMVMRAGYDHAGSILGSSTACVVAVNHDPQNPLSLKLQAANLGDSGFLLLRDGRIIYESSVQQKSFNFPYQLGGYSSDMPEHSDLYEFPLMPGDYIVVVSDGYLDNVFGDDLERVFRNWKQGFDPSPMALADTLAHFSSIKANEQTGLSPFAQEARAKGYRFQGGKLDDITVVVARVKNISQSQ